MKCGKLTAKLRDAVPICLMVDGKEVKRYKNIEIPEEIQKQSAFLEGELILSNYRKREYKEDSEAAKDSVMLEPYEVRYYYWKK